MIRFTIVTLSLGACLAIAVGQTISVHKQVKKIYTNMDAVDKAAVAA